MDKLKDMSKGGWKPGGGSSGSSSAAPEKGSTLTGLGLRNHGRSGIHKGMKLAGRGGEDPNERARDHVSQPLSSLKDPASFAPPPKHVNSHGGAVLSDRQSPHQPGLGAPVPAPAFQNQRQQHQGHGMQTAEDEAEEEAPPVPYRADTTGLSTANLPPPPRRNVESPVPATPPSAPSSRPKPNLPPRLPPRQNSRPDVNAPPPPPTYGEATQAPDTSAGQLNESSMERLGRAGVSVPGFGIGGGQASTPPESPRKAPELSELQQRFSRMNTQPQEPAAQSQGTSWQQKQQAMNTAQSFRKEPSSVSLSDARSAATTANNFRERHGDQVSSGLSKANGLNQKYGIASRLGGINTSAASNEPSPPATPLSPAGKKPPPPPPPKKAALSGNSLPNSPVAPPQLPLGSKLSEHANKVEATEIADANTDWEPDPVDRWDKDPYLPPKSLLYDINENYHYNQEHFLDELVELVQVVSPADVLKHIPPTDKSKISKDRGERLEKWIEQIQWLARELVLLCPGSITQSLIETLGETITSRKQAIAYHQKGKANDECIGHQHVVSEFSEILESLKAGQKSSNVEMPRGRPETGWVQPEYKGSGCRCCSDSE